MSTEAATAVPQNHTNSVPDPRNFLMRAAIALF